MLQAEACGLHSATGSTVMTTICNSLWHVDDDIGQTLLVMVWDSRFTNAIL